MRSILARRCLARLLRCGWLFGILSGLAVPARADVYGYVDEKGVAHFSAERVDERYELFLRGAAIVPAPASPAPASDSPGAAVYPVAAPSRPSRLVAFFELSPSFRLVKEHMREAASSQNIEFELLQALIATESGFDAGAVSPKGAIGLMQIMPATARRYGVDDEAHAGLQRRLTEPRLNIRTGTRYLRDLINMFPGQIELALAAYNAGEGAVQRAGNRIPNIKETQNYVRTILELYTALKAPVLPRAAELPVPPREPLAKAPPVIRGGAFSRGTMGPGIRITGFEPFPKSDTGPSR